MLSLHRYTIPTLRFRKTAPTTFRESSFNMTRGGDEDVETRSLKF